MTLAKEYELIEACKEGDLGRVQELLPATNPLLEDSDGLVGSRALWMACWNSHPEIVRLLLEDGRIDPSFEENKALRYVCFYSSSSGHGKNKEILQMLLDDPRVDPNAKEGEALRWAAWKGDSAVVQLLLSHPNIERTAKDNQALRWALRREHQEIARMLQ